MKKFIFKKSTVEASRKTRIEGKLNKLSYINNTKNFKNQLAEKKSANLKLKLNLHGTRTGVSKALQKQENDAESLKMKAMRRFYNKAMPTLQCATCAFATQCPQFKSGYECAYLPFFKSHTIRNTEDLLTHAKDILEANMQRAHVAMTMETLSGAAPSPELSESLMMLFSQLMSLHERVTEQQNTSLEISAEGDETIIGSLFGNLNNLIAETQQAIEKPITDTSVDLPMTEDSKMALAVMPISDTVNLTTDNDKKLPSSKIEVVELT